ncbi:MAG: chemotaxis protein CheB [Opitutaceae bacterium]|nr:chemotaxis protein CheB [Opitutaceae bacterium]
MEDSPRTIQVADGGDAPLLVAVGASAGGLDALSRFFAAMPSGCGLAFVVLQHLSPDHRSFMVELLSKKTSMEVFRAEDGTKPLADRVYLLPPGKDLTLSGGAFRLLEPTIDRGIHLPIDTFFKSLAEERRQKSICIILSGSGSDGTSGVRAIKDSGGVVFVQSEETAQFNGMPRSAMSTGLVDFVGSPEELPALLLRYVRHPLAYSEPSIGMAPGDEEVMQETFRVLREHTGVDFSGYKQATIERRIQRRMTIHQIDSLKDYLLFLNNSPQEVQHLFNEFLINVTRFFRDPEVWEHLSSTVLPQLVERSHINDPIRAWVPACASGEEAYTLAILLVEACEKLGINREIKIFATDISKHVIEQAAKGTYVESIVCDLTPSRLSRFFIQNPEGYVVAPAIRKLVVFARHNILSDPPFTRLDLVSCRNFLIYVQPELQAKVLGSFHFSLKTEGLLLLGTSETVGDTVDRFHAVSNRHKLFRRKSGTPGMDVFVPSGVPSASLERKASTRSNGAKDPAHGLELLHRAVMQDKVGACIVVNERYDVLYSLGKASEYLVQPEGTPTNNFVKLTAASVGTAAQTALRRAAQSDELFVHGNVRFKRNKRNACVRLSVRRCLLEEGRGPVFLVYLDEVKARSKRRGTGVDNPADSSLDAHIKDLETDLESTRETLQATIEELELSNEELQASNEELLASNEELQSTNEELQSLNEELHTVNSENQNRIHDLLKLTDDINNLLTCSQIGTMLVDENLRVRRMSSAISSLTRMTVEDIGAPLEVLDRMLGVSVLGMAQSVQATLVSSEIEVRTPEKRFLLVRAAPFRVEGKPTRGVTITIIDVSERMENQVRLANTADELQRIKYFIQGIIDAIPASVAILDLRGTITHVNQCWTSFCRDNNGHGVCNGLGVNYLEICSRSEDGRVAADGIRAVAEGRQQVFILEYPCHSPTQRRWFRMQASTLNPLNQGVLICHIDISEARKNLAT